MTGPTGLALKAIQAEEEMPYHCLLCRKKVFADREKKAKALAKSKAKKPAAKGGLKRSMSSVSKSSPKARTVKETNESPIVDDEDAPETPVSCPKKPANDSKEPPSKGNQSKNTKSSSASALPSKSSL